MFMTLVFMVRIARVSGTGYGTDRRTRTVYCAGCRVPEQYRGIGIRIEDDIVITEPVMKTSPPAW